MQTITGLTPPETLLEQTYRAILNAICDGRLAPGERLTQEHIAELLKVSRQPVAQALTLLKNQGFVKETGRRGLIVAHLDPVFFKAIYELRSAIDPMAARLAAQRMDGKAKQEGKAIIEDGQRALRSGELGALVQADARFHAYVYELSGNPLITEVMNLYWNHLRRAMGEVLHAKGEGKRVLEEHEQILDALIAGDAEGAARTAQAHVLSAVGRVLSAVEAHAKTVHD